MGKKRKAFRPWCWYCEKDFEDDKVLVTHQRAKHFKCEVCNKRLTTAGGMAVHAMQVHKVEIKTVPNAMPGRDTLEHEIFGMEGIPPQDLESYELRKMGGEAAKRARGGGGGGSSQFGELTAEQIAAQLALHKAGASPGAPGAVAAVTAATPPVVPPAYQQPQYYGGYSQPPAGMAYPGYNQYYQTYPGQPYPYRPPPLHPGAPIPPYATGPWDAQRPPAAAYTAPYAQQQQQQQQQGYPAGQTPEMAYRPPQQPTQAGPQGSYYPSATAAAANAATSAAAAAGYDYSTTVAPTSADLAAATGSTTEGEGTVPSASASTTAGTATSGTAITAATDGSGSGTTKKKASKTVLIYSDNEVSPEERRAMLEKHRVADAA